MSDVASAVPKGYRNLTPYLVVRGVERLLDFLKASFSAQEQIRSLDSDRCIVHAAVQIGDSIVEMGDPGRTDYPELPASLHYYVPDADAVFLQALRSGAKSLYSPQNMDYGDREAGITDPCGNHWFIATHKQGTSYRPEHLRDVNFGLSVKDAAAFITFAQNAFAATVLDKHANGAGLVGHAKLRIGDSVFEISEAHDQWGPRPCAIHYYSPNCDDIFSRGLAAGAKLLLPMQDQVYGDRGGGLIDDWGNHWYIATHKQDLTMDEIQQRAAQAPRGN
jgi:PhnB protein